MEELLNKYGIKSVLAAAIFVVVTWVIAHKMAEPGSTVSVGWGLVEYTKSNELENVNNSVVANKSPSSLPPESKPIVTSPSENSAVSQPPSNYNLSSTPQKIDTLKVSVFDDVQETQDVRLKELRKSSGLRPLRNLESGSKIKHVGNQTYFFTLTGWLDGVGEYRPLENLETHLEKTYMYDFELHKDNDSNLFLVGFMTQSDAQRLASTQGEELKRLLVSPNYIDDFKSLVKFPAKFVSNLEDRYVATTQNKEVKVIQFDYKK
ncbi:hypothetical protein [Vibrio hyugaensis]|uniref:hypothetical protein n=1 Tax=Vibrio hyugaensis TaxID=1534743 RepID=UPI000CE2D705|nr:hypothetical protein [Vibrio hyugaensis]